MDRHTQVSVEDGIVRVTIMGEVRPSHSSDAITKAARAAQDAGSKLLLFDITHAQYREYHALALSHARDAYRTGMVKFRIAILGKADDAKLPYFENVAINRGIRARSFTKERDALKWLKGPAP
ncbi:MAG TPA: hypothetical protein VII36_10745 [Usitatibacter sp.]